MVSGGNGVSEILIKNWKIPENCYECPMMKNHLFHDGQKWQTGCFIETASNITFVEKRPSWCPLIEVPLHRDWHTGQPTEEGWYLCAYGDNFYCANYWQGGTWKNQWGGTLLAYQKIEPYVSSKEGE